ncbi:MAG: hypothetical protein PUB99_10870 [Oscillospiraceae bacterium]|nr:hypothetical protein [Oscillospiraceae bacterium]
MKRAVCLLAMILLFAGCSKVTPNVPPTYALPLSGTVQISTELLDMSAAWNYTADAMTFSLTSPQELSGTVVTCGAEKTVTSQGITVPMAQTACFEALQKAWLVFMNAQTEPAETPEGWRYDFTVTDGFSVLQSMDGGVMRFQFAHSETEAVFSVETARIP